MNPPKPDDSVEHLNDPHALGRELEPVIQKACEGRLGKIEWFRSQWQQGGAATGFSTYRRDDGVEQAVLVKIPVSGKELRWTLALSDAGFEHTPRVLASGSTLGNYDLAWLILERLQGKTIGKDLSKNCVEALLKTTCLFHKTAEQIQPVSMVDIAKPPDWGGLLERAHKAVRENSLRHEQRWNSVLGKVHRGLDEIIRKWKSRPINTWCHGDVHPGNALYRGPGAHEGKLVLIDLALVHGGHWIEDALYLERLYWGHENLLHGVKPVSTLARLRKKMGLETGNDYPHLANIRRILMSATVPAFLGREGNAAYVDASLGVLEGLAGQILR